MVEEVATLNGDTLWILFHNGDIDKSYKVELKPRCIDGLYMFACSYHEVSVIAAKPTDVLKIWYIKEGDMSSNLRWEPIADRGKILSDELKYLLRKTRDSRIVEIILSDSDVAYLSGLRDASSEKLGKEIQCLITAINKHGNVRVWEEF
jgi:hypothetical protein